jgi:hypothetical protein
MRLFLIKQQITDVAGCSPELLEIMTELFTAVRLSGSGSHPSDGYQDLLKDLQLRLNNIRQKLRTHDDVPPQGMHKLKSVAELYRIACLIYLERVGRGRTKWNSGVTKLVEDGFKLLKTLGSCEKPFPLFVMSCEASTDDQRQTVLQAIFKTQEERNVGNMNYIKTMVEAAWVHEDLHGEEELPAIAKYNFVISACQTLPAFT